MKEKNMIIIDMVICILIGITVPLSFTLNLYYGLTVLLMGILYHILRWNVYDYLKGQKSEQESEL